MIYFSLLIILHLRVLILLRADLGPVFVLIGP